MSYQNILTAVKKLEQPDKAMRLTQSIVENSSAQVTLLYPFHGLCAMGLGYSLPSIVEREQQELKKVEARLANMAKQAPLRGCSAKVTVGSSKGMIVKQAKKMGADLIIIDADQSLDDKHILKSLFTKAPCDVLVVRNHNKEQT